MGGETGGDPQVEVARAETSHRRRTGGARRNRLGVGSAADGGSRHGRGLRRATALLLPGTALLRAWRPTWTQFRDPVRARRACGLGLWPFDGRRLVRFRARCDARARERGARGLERRGTLRHAAGGRREEVCASHGGRRGQVSAPRHGHVGRMVGFRRSASHHRPVVVTCSVGVRWLPSREPCGPEPASEGTPNARGVVAWGSRFARDPACVVRHGPSRVRVIWSQGTGI